MSRGWRCGCGGWGANMRGWSQRSRPSMSRNTSQRGPECWMRNGQGGYAVIYTPVTSKYTRTRGQAPICLVIGVLKTARSLEDNNAAYFEQCALDLQTFMISWQGRKVKQIHLTITRLRFARTCYPFYLNTN